MNHAVFPLRAPVRLVSIGDLARQLGVTPRALRHYQDRGLVRSHRLSGNVRGYDAEAVEQLETITALRAVGLPIAAIRQVLELRDRPEAQADALREALSGVLQARRDQVTRLEEMLEEASASPGALASVVAAGKSFA
ncbi:MerR family transcriptional regulator [Caulobacter sp. RL271]|jgi:DNA-binding transcriptional MerR regulator|uniref:MerR family transcriptional regulator n=1 Tax=Caulobacter segnis TaxID=88688 RepID=A0ABY4ZXC5_9CAUL|nr:MerR family transcriptional regulator [Caulobacter segnis]USQ97395.1 MerR family transcriptional regulator [Caulobacter segnis]